MNLLNKLFLQKIALICTVLLLSACGGGSSREALSSTVELQKLADNAVAQPLVIAPTGLNTSLINSNLPGIADIYIGTLDVPYYFDTANSTSSFWLPSLAVRETLTVPVMMTLPNINSGQTMPAAGWPIVMYQHGITRNRTDVVAYADGLAQVGFAVIAIDLPTHGLTDGSNPFHAESGAFPTALQLNATEQTFGVDIRTQDPITGATTAAVGDGIVDNSGTHFINIPSLLTSRDNLRQGAANLLTLRRSLGNIPNIDTSRVGLIAHSLGGMVAVPYLGVETTPTPSSIVMSGATITTVLKESTSFSPVIAQGLAGIGVISDVDVDAFYINAQVIVDAAEPANYAAAAAANHPIHLIQVIGDQTVPNSSTENLATLMGAKSISTTTPGIDAGNPGIVRFTEGAHSSPLDPTASFDATVEIQTQLAAFQAFATSPSVIVISNGCVIQGGTCNNMPQ